MARIDDDFSKPTVFSGSLNTAVVVDNTGATVEPGEDVAYDEAPYGLNTGDKTLWFSYRPTATGLATFESSSQQVVDSHLQVFEGDFTSSSQIAEGSATQTPVGENITLIGSIVSFNAVEGHTYYIQLASYPDSLDAGYNTGELTLTQTDGPEGDPACYCAGTLIETEAGERLVEDLRIGERLVTASGSLKAVRWIGRRSYAAPFASRRIAPVRIAAGALGDGLPRRDLWVSPCHAMLIDGLLIGAEDLVNGVTVTQPPVEGPVHYLHIELDEHDAILAEGAASETFLPSANARLRFHNVAEFAALYPDAPLDPLARFCAPRATGGHAFEVAVQRIRDRAGLVRTAVDLGPLDGVVERIAPGVVTGWAASPRHPGAPVCLQIVADGRVVAETLANRPRRRGERTGFEVRLPELAVGAVVEVRRALDRRVLPVAQINAAAA